MFTLNFTSGGAKNHQFLEVGRARLLTITLQSSVENWHLAYTVKKGESQSVSFYGNESSERKRWAPRIDSGRNGRLAWHLQKANKPLL